MLEDDALKVIRFPPDCIFWDLKTDLVTNIIERPAFYLARGSFGHRLLERKLTEAFCLSLSDQPEFRFYGGPSFFDSAE